MDNAIKFLREYVGVREFLVTANKLRVLVVPRHLGKIVVFMVHYNVGSRHEAVGHTGATHFLEHLLFKGSARFPKETQPLDKVFALTGAVVNANTWNDRTAYYEAVLPKHLDKVMEVEADRMRGASFTDEDRQNEMTVVRNELERIESDPGALLSDLVMATAIQEHPYHHPTIGYKSDIEGVATERIRAFYDTFYYPNNAVVMVIGNVNEKGVLAMILKHFGSIPASPRPIPETHTIEPPQRGERRVVLRRPGQNGIICFGWTVPGFAHDDFAALDVLTYMLTDGEGSLLVDRFVSTGKVQSISSFLGSLKDPNPLSISIRLLRAKGHRGVECDILACLKELKDGGITDEHVERAKRLALAGFAYGEDDPISLAMQLSFAEGAGSWSLNGRLYERTNEVTRDTLLAVMRKYFIPDNMTVGWFVPMREGGTA